MYTEKKNNLHKFVSVTLPAKSTDEFFICPKVPTLTLRKYFLHSDIQISF